MNNKVWFLAMCACALLAACIGEPFTACEECSSSSTSGATSTDSSSGMSTASTSGSSSSDGGGGGSTVSTGGGGTTSSSSSGGQGGTGGNDCPNGKKNCDGNCVQIDNPAYGCTPDGCEPCVLANASATCDASACVIDACDQDFEDCDNDPATGCEADLLHDLDHCGACNDSCSVTNAACDIGLCTGPCGPVPDTGLFVCWVYGAIPVPGNEYVGLAGGEADPDQGQTIQNQFLDPMCVNPMPGENFVLCDLGAPDANWDIQFRAGLHATPGTGTIAGTWDCSDATCAGEAYVYQDKTEIGSLVSDVATGVVSTLPHFNPPGLLNVKVTVP